MTCSSSAETYVILCLVSLPPNSPFPFQLEEVQKANTSLSERLAASEAALRAAEAEKQALLNDAAMTEQRLKLLEQKQDTGEGAEANLQSLNKLFKCFSFSDNMYNRMLG